MSDDRIFLFNLTTNKSWRIPRYVHDSWDEFRSRVECDDTRIAVGDHYVYWEMEMGHGGLPGGIERERLGEYPWRRPVEPRVNWKLDWNNWKISKAEKRGRIPQ